MSKAITCPNCGRELREGDKFCAYCGVKIQQSGATKICASCGTANDAKNVFCVTCGTSLQETASQPAEHKRTSGKGAASKSTQSSMPWLKNVFIGFAVIVVAVIIYEIIQTPHGEVVKGNVPQQQLQNQSSPQTAEMLQRIKELEEHLKTAPHDQQAMLELANRLHDAHFYPRAVEAYKKYLEVNSHDADARVDMGICYFESGNFDQAVKEIELALKQSPKHQMAMFNLGVMYLNQGDMAKSNEWLAKCSAINPSTEVGKKAQQILNQHKLN